MRLYVRGALCDYHDVCDTRLDCFACDDTHACGELYGMCYDSYRPNVPGDGTIFHRAQADDRSTGAMSAPKPTVLGDGDRPLSSDSEPPGDTEKQADLDLVAPFPVL